MSKIKGLIYQAYNKISKKSYIGQTVRTLKLRKYQHYYYAKKHNNNKFQNALNKYNVEDWEWTILEKDITQQNLNEREMYYINALDTHKKGYNSTVGGDGSIGTGGIYRFYHDDYGWIEGDILSISAATGLSRSAFYHLSKGLYESAKGWRLTNEVQKKKIYKKDRVILKKIYIIEVDGIRVEGTYQDIVNTYNVDMTYVKKISKSKRSRYKYIGEKTIPLKEFKKDN